jgi:hypothetical protein
VNFAQAVYTVFTIYARGLLEGTDSGSGLLPSDLYLATAANPASSSGEAGDAAAPGTGGVALSPPRPRKKKRSKILNLVNSILGTSFGDLDSMRATAGKRHVPLEVRHLPQGKMTVNVLHLTPRFLFHSCFPPGVSFAPS